VLHFNQVSSIEETSDDAKEDSHSFQLRLAKLTQRMKQALMPC